MSHQCNKNALYMVGLLKAKKKYLLPMICLEIGYVGWSNYIFYYYCCFLLLRFLLFFFFFVILLGFFLLCELDVRKYSYEQLAICCMNYYSFADILFTYLFNHLLKNGFSPLEVLGVRTEPLPSPPVFIDLY